MGADVEYYEYLSQDRITSMFNQIPRRRWLASPPDYSVGVQIPPVLSVRVSAGKSNGKEPEIETQLKAVLAYLHKHEPAHIGTIDEPKKFIAGTLPVFSYLLPQGFRTPLDAEPELVYYGASTPSTILGLSGPFQNLIPSGRPASQGSMHPASSAIPYLASLLAQEFRTQTRFQHYQSDESIALSFVNYAERYNRRGRPLRNCAFFATVRLDSAKVGGIQRKKRLILATPLYVACED